ncbi:MAG: hypothetical protein JXB36_13955 [Gammaproteobacteria bacterium]|nr:hypothetical protein [Gammaproteobacteria bacterium]
MSEQKSHQFRPPLYHDGNGGRHASKKPQRPVAEPSKDQQGWEAYRKWLTHVSKKPGSERTPADHSIYSWKGYHNWADKVRQSWKPDDGQ